MEQCLPYGDQLEVANRFSAALLAASRVLAGLRHLTQEAGRDICTDLTRRRAGGEVLVGQLRSTVADDEIAVDSVS
jgi:hypothetical protein